MTLGGLFCLLSRSDLVINKLIILQFSFCCKGSQVCGTVEDATEKASLIQELGGAFKVLGKLILFSHDHLGQVASGAWRTIA